MVTAWFSLSLSPSPSPSLSLSLKKDALVVQPCDLSLAFQEESLTEAPSGDYYLTSINPIFPTIVCGPHNKYT